jgi:Flp pilus assembly protein TadD
MGYLLVEAAKDHHPITQAAQRTDYLTKSTMYFEKAIRQDDREPKAYAGKGLMYLHMGKFDEARNNI